MFSTLKELIAVYAMPLPLFLCLLGLAALLFFSGRRRAGLGTGVLATVMLLLAAWSPVADRLLEPLESRYPPLQISDGEPWVETIVVLGGGWQPERGGSSLSRLNESSLYRLTEGLKLLKDFPQARLVVSGGSRVEGLAPVAEAYARAANELGVSSERLVVIDWPTDTAGEAQAVRDLLGEDSRPLLVTSASHMPRAMAHFRAVGLDPVAAPTHRMVNPGMKWSLIDWLPTSQALSKTERALHEYMGLAALQWEH
ncbi:YdcF family protein [Billgrantia saliphila]|uniref:YdcF family protein n=1 Tax=Billgrantia saliphila TaxID=1848458 RepID=UPI000CE38115|nr:ElyC/SanA/YdcF family protein [Halomonas saliphila]